MFASLEEKDLERVGGLLGHNEVFETHVSLFETLVKLWRNHRSGYVRFFSSQVAEIAQVRAYEQVLLVACANISPKLWPRRAFAGCRDRKLWSPDGGTTHHSFRCPGMCAEA